MEQHVGRVHYLEALPPAAERPRGVLVLLHAFPLSARMWEEQLVLAAGGWRILAPDFRGVGGGAGKAPAASLDDYAGDVIDLLDALHIQEAVVAGLSMGGYAAFALLRRAARYVRALILADTRPQADTPEGLAARERLLQLVTEKGAGAVADEMIPKLLGETTRRTRPEVVERVRGLILTSPAPAIAGEIRALMTRQDSTPLLSTIHIPTLIVVGDEDAVTPPTVAHEMRAAIAGAEIAVIPGAGHLSNVEQPAVFNAAVARFLELRV